MKSNTSGYSGTPLLKKLGIQGGHRIVLVDAPEPLPGDLADMPIGVEMFFGLRGRGPYDVALLFVKDRASLEKRFGTCATRLQPNGALWVAWPKRASGIPTDVTENVVREVALAEGLVDNKVCAIDGTWSGLRCVYRLKDRPRPERG